MSDQLSVTGVLLMYEKQMIAWADDWGCRVTPGAARLPVETLIAGFRAARSHRVDESVHRAGARRGLGEDA